MRTHVRYAAGFGVLLLAGCSSVAPIQQDQPIYLQPGQGLMAVVLDTLDPITQVIIDPSTPGGAKIDIPSVPAGINVYLYAVPAGNYCFTAFQYGNWHFKGEQGQLACFQVKAGELGYSGSLAPRVDNGQVDSHQNMDLEGFRTLMNQRYPIIAKQFLPLPAPQGPPPASEPSVRAAPTASTAPPPALANLTPRTPPAAGKDQISSWVEDVPGTRDQVVFFRNNTGWTLEVVNFELYDCIAIKQTCGVQKLKLMIPPHASRAAIVIEPAEPDDAYSYRTRYYYGFTQNQKP